MQPRIRMIAVDLDGTLLNSRKRVSAEDAEALRAAAARGVEIVPVTGRNFSTALPIVADLLTGGPLIASNGAIIRSKTGETFLRGLVPVAVAEAVLRATREYRAYTVLTYDQEGQGQFRIETPHQSRDPKRHMDGVSRHIDVVQGAGHVVAPPDGVAASPWIGKYSAAVRFAESLERELDGDPVEIMFAGPLALMREVADLLTKLATERNDIDMSFRRHRGILVKTGNSKEAEGAGEVQVPRRFPRLRSGQASPRDDSENSLGAEAKEAEETMRFRLLRTEYPERDFAIVDVIQRDCSKGRALEAWSRFRGIPPGEIMAIGDNYNDLDMLRFAGVPIVMGNSEEALKQEGWPVTLDCDSGGVARAVERYVLGSRE